MQQRPSKKGATASSRQAKATTITTTTKTTSSTSQKQVVQRQQEQHGTKEISEKDHAIAKQAEVLLEVLKKNDGLQKEKEAFLKTKYKKRALQKDMGSLASRCKDLEKANADLKAQLLKESRAFYDTGKGGLVLVFSQSDLREGNDMDLRALREAFGAMGPPEVKVVVQENLQRKQLMNFKLPKSLKDSKVSFVCVVVMAHGNQDRYGREYFEASDENPGLRRVILNSFMAQFLENERCPRLARGKPKIMIVSNCRGEDENRKVEAEGASPSAKVANVQDTYVMRATVGGTETYRHPSHGNFFIQALCKILKADPTVDLEELFRRVTPLMNEDFARKMNKGPYGQLAVDNLALVPESTSTMTKRFRFCSADASKGTN